MGWYTVQDMDRALVDGLLRLHWDENFDDQKYKALDSAFVCNFGTRYGKRVAGEKLELALLPLPGNLHQAVNQAEINCVPMSLRENTQKDKSKRKLKNNTPKKRKITPKKINGTHEKMTNTSKKKKNILK